MKRRFFSKGSRILLGMSGGVDSCAAALLLKQQGYNVSGLTLILCPDASPNDQNIADAKAVCDALGMEHTTLDLRERFDSTVMRNFAEEYSCGRTPNPCIICNKEIKFGAMLDYALENGFDAVATGHYADIVQDDSGWCRIAKAPTAKDQSYVLWQLSQHQLSHTLLPLADYTKDELRQMIKETGLPVYSKPDSQDICFIPDGDYVDFLRRYADIVPKEGSFIDAQGNVIGRHKGTVCYTIGQRKGLGGGFSEPKYVTKLNMQTNEITLGGEGSQYASRMICSMVNLHLRAEYTPQSFTAQVKHRYSARPSEAHITLSTDGSKCEVVFTQPQRALTPGQSAVFYEDNLLLGGAVIKEVIE